MSEWCIFKVGHVSPADVECVRAGDLPEKDGSEQAASACRLPFRSAEADLLGAAFLEDRVRRQLRELVAKAFDNQAVFVAMAVVLGLLPLAFLLGVFLLR
jgi:hypothetical protein